MKNILKTGLATLAFSSSVCKAAAERITITDYSAWQAANAETKISFLKGALEKMKENDKLRLVITEDTKDGWLFSGKPGEVYVSDQSGEGMISYGAYWHNMFTWQTILELYKNILETKAVDEQAINDSLDLLLPKTYGNIQESLDKLLGKDIKLNHLENILEIISTPQVLCIKAESIKEKTTTEPSGSKKMIPARPRGAKVFEFVKAGNARAEQLQKEQDILDGKVKKKALD